MRIGMMADIYKPHISGVTNYIELNKTYLEKAGHQVFVFTFGEEDQQDDDPNVIRSPGLPLRAPKAYADIQVGLRYDAKARRLLQTMDIVHAHHPFLSTTLALRHCKPRGIPIVFTNHTRYDLMAQAYLTLLPEFVGELVGELFIKTYLPSVCQAIDLVIAPSPSIKEYLQRIGVNTSVEMIPHGVDLAPFREQFQPFARSKFGFTSYDVIVIYVGRLGPEKNIPFLLRAFYGAVQASPNLGLLLVGDGPERDNLEAMVEHMNIAERVRFTGLVNYKDLPPYLASADVAATASVSETFGLSVVEAMASGLPILGIRSPGIVDNVVDGVSGLLAENDLASFAAKMMMLVNDRELRQSMGEQARKAAEAFAIERTVELMLSHYRRLLEQKKETKRGLGSMVQRLFSGRK